MEVQAKLLTDLRFTIETGSGYHVILDSATAAAREAADPCPTDLLLVALAGCMGMSLTTILRKMKQSISSYEIHIQAEKNQRPPYIFTAIQLEHVISGLDIAPAALQRAITLAEERYCSVGIMLKETVHVTHTFRII